MTVFTPTEIAYLAQQRIGRLATLRPDGSVQVNPVGFYLNDELGVLDIGGTGMAGSQKFRNVAATATVALVADDMPSVNPLRVRCLEIRGHGEALLDPPDSAFHRPGPIIRIHPRRIVSFGVDVGNPASGTRTVSEV